MKRAALLAALVLLGCGPTPPKDASVTVHVLRGQADPLSDPGLNGKPASSVNKVEALWTSGGATKTESANVGADRKVALRFDVKPSDGTLRLRTLRSDDGKPYAGGRALTSHVEEGGNVDVPIFVGPIDAFTSVTGDLGGPRTGAAMAALGNRGALISGGVTTGTTLADPSVQLYVRSEGKLCGFADGCLKGEKPEPRRDGIAVSLSDGSVLHGLGVLGTGAADDTLFLTKADGTTERFPVGCPSGAGATAVALNDGTALVFGGTESGNPSASVYRVDPVTKAVSAQTSLLEPRRNAGVIALSTGQVLVVGGEGAAGALSTAELFTPGQGPQALDGAAFAQARKLMKSGRIAPSLARLSDDTVLIFGGGSGAPEVFRLELGALVGGFVDLTPPATDLMLQQPAMTRLPDGTILFVGGEATGAPKAVALRFTPEANQVLGPQSPTFLGAYKAVGASGALRASPLVVQLADQSLLLAGGQETGPSIEVMVPSGPDL